jgi:hypothetical protein
VNNDGPSDGTSKDGASGDPWDEIFCVEYLEKLLCILEIAPGNVPPDCE